MDFARERAILKQDRSLCSALVAGRKRTCTKARDLLAQPMKVLIVGRNRTDALLKYALKCVSLLVFDDGSFIDKYISLTRKKYIELDFSKDSLNPITRMDYRRRRNFIAAIDAIFERGDTTITKDTGLGFIRRSLKLRPKTLESLIPYPDKKSSTGHVWAYEKIEEILDSPVLKDFLCNDTTFHQQGIILVRLDPSKLPEFDRHVLVNVLIGRFHRRGVVFFSNFGSYVRPFHRFLAEEDRIIAGVNSLNELPPQIRNLMLLGTFEGHATTFADAEVLAENKGLRPDPMRDENPYNKFIEEAMG